MYLLTLSPSFYTSTNLILNLNLKKENRFTVPMQRAKR
jgi:hypothetical protein